MKETNKFTNGEYIHRIARLKDRLVSEGLDGAILLYPTDIYYFTGTRQNAALWVPAAGEPVLLVRKSLERAALESAVSDVRPFPPSRELPALFDHGAKRIGLTCDVLPVQHYRFYANLLKGIELADISAVNRDLRAVKSEAELDLLRTSGRRLAAVFAEIPLFLIPGIREVDLAAELEYRLKRAGSEGRFRMRAFGQDIAGLAVAGESGAAPGCFDGPITGRGISASSPFGSSEAVIMEDTPVLVDYAGVFDAYIVDMTRVFVIGKLPDNMQKAFSEALRIQSWLAENLRPGAVCEDLYNASVVMAREAGLGEQFMGQAKFVGHGVGLELDELPVLAKGFQSPLQAGNTIAIEPKFIFPGIGAIGIENTFAVTDKGGELLTALPDDIVYL